MLPPDIPIYPEYLVYEGSPTCNPAETNDLVDDQPPSVESYILSDDDENASEWDAANDADNAFAFVYPPASVPPRYDSPSADESDSAYESDSDYVEAKAAVPQPKLKGTQKVKAQSRAPARQIAPLPSRARGTNATTTTSTPTQPLVGSSSFNAAHDSDSESESDEGDAGPSTLPLICSICGHKKCTTEGGLRRHHRNNHGPDAHPWKCPHCGKGLKTSRKDAFEKHWRSKGCKTRAAQRG
ncbi:hypothetical protein FB45DRAFT_1018797 [Roridomyces roridus]|uniref:C2H2-type domain-containing protein n=1 Tax=Roridomyces roridus TaxID=1738132 RepID=A0AAD7CDJ8_9AGAR|nr:hypothetical protein FB45DRAFT_1018797 [Roridomyces roridus]